MARPASVWVNPKFKSYKYRGNYERTGRSQDRVFVLTRINGRAHVVTCESFNDAKAKGWKKIA